jgi:hypothetical protein
MSEKVTLSDEQREALQEAICWAQDEGLPGTADHLRALLAASSPECGSGEEHEHGVIDSFKRFAIGQGYDLTTYEEKGVLQSDDGTPLPTFWSGKTEHAWRGWANRTNVPAQPAQDYPTGDQLRTIIRSVGSFGTNHSDAPTAYVLAGWKAARASSPAPSREDCVIALQVLSEFVMNIANDPDANSELRDAARSTLWLAEIDRINRGSDHAD